MTLSGKRALFSEFKFGVSLSTPGGGGGTQSEVLSQVSGPRSFPPNANSLLKSFSGQISRGKPQEAYYPQHNLSRGHPIPTRGYPSPVLTGGGYPSSIWGEIPQSLQEYPVPGSSPGLWSQVFSRGIPPVLARGTQVLSREAPLSWGTPWLELGHPSARTGLSLKFCLVALKRSSDFGSALLKYYVDVQVLYVNEYASHT